MGSFAPHKFVKLTELNSEFSELTKIDILDDLFSYMLEVYMDDYIVLPISRTQDQLQHVTSNVIK